MPGTFCQVGSCRRTYIGAWLSNSADLFWSFEYLYFCFCKVGSCCRTQNQSWRSGVYPSGGQPTPWGVCWEKMNLDNWIKEVETFSGLQGHAVSGTPERRGTCEADSIHPRYFQQNVNLGNISTPTLCRHLTNSSSPRTWEIAQKGNHSLPFITTYLQDSWADPCHDPHTHCHVSWVGQLNSNFCERRSDGTHAANGIIRLAISHHLQSRCWRTDFCDPQNNIFKAHLKGIINIHDPPFHMTGKTNCLESS